MFNDLSPLSLNEKTINYSSLPGEANYNKNPTWFPSSSTPPRGCSGTASSVKAAQAKFIQSGGNYPYQYTGESLGLPSGRMGYGEIKRYNNSEFIKRSTNDYDNIFPHKMLMGGKKGRKSKQMIGCKSMFGGKKRSTKKRSTKKQSTKKQSTKKRSTKKRSTKKRSTKKRSTKKRSSKKTKSSKNKRSSKKTARKYRGGNSNVLPTFINEFNTTLSPDESGMASPTPLTRTPGDCTYIKY
jgi:hypothetical protein